MDKDKFSDRGYKFLFSHPGMVEDLLKSFVKEDFVKEIDFPTLKRISSSYVTEEFKNRESDIVWEVRIKGKLAYIYILIEFQSTVDRFMALRMLTYTLLFYQDLLKRKKLINLPPVFPLLLYNGNAKWDAPESLSQLIEVPFASLRKFVPQFRYYKIAENEFSRKSLLELKNLVAHLFMLETSSAEELASTIEGIIRILNKEVEPKLKRDFGLWVRGVLLRKRIDIDITKLDEMEVRPMLLENLQKFEDEVFLKGRVEGKLGDLKLILEAKFGEDGRKLFRSIEKIQDIKKLEKLMCSVAMEHDVAKIRNSLKIH